MPPNSSFLAWRDVGFFQKRGAAEGQEEDRLSDEIIFSAEPEELEEEEVWEAFEEVEEGNLLCIGSF